MSELEKKERLIELLFDQATAELSEENRLELEELSEEFSEHAQNTGVNETVSAITIQGLELEESMPSSLESKIFADASDFIQEAKPVDKADQVLTKEPDSSSSPPFWQWLTPVFAGIGCIALLASFWVNSNRPGTTAEIPKPPAKLSLGEQREVLVASAKDLVKTSWISPTGDKNLTGEVVWSDSKQQGYMTFKGLAKNDIEKEAYQLWIFEQSELEKHPKDGGVFDIDRNGEVIIPIDAKLKVTEPKAFAVTVEKPGGVVVSDRKKIVALGKV